tara:strand:+ start:798 stop:1493 length:696 start_codon:yes stop_codon:yes gene_type:complete
MKSNIIKTLIIVILINSSLFSQQTYTDRAQQAFIDLSNRKADLNNSNTNIKGSQYFNDSFVRGSINYFGREVNEEIFIRYNAFKDEVEMSESESNSNEVFILIKSKDVIPKIDGIAYYYLAHRLDDSRASIGYLNIVFKGENYILYSKKRKIFMDGIKARTSFEKDFPPRFIDTEDYLISFNNDTPVPIKLSKRGLINYFGKEISVYIRKNRLKASELSSLIQIINYYESQ